MKNYINRLSILLLCLIPSFNFAQGQALASDVQRILDQLCADPVFARQLNITNPTLLKSFYAMNENQLIWQSPNHPFVKGFIQTARQAYRFGLTPESYHLSYLSMPNSSKIEYDLVCSDAMLNFLKDVSVGKVPHTLSFNVLKYNHAVLDIPMILTSKYVNYSFEEIARDVQPKSSHYQALLKVLGAIQHESYSYPSVVASTLVGNAPLLQKLYFWGLITSPRAVDNPTEQVIKEGVMRFQQLFSLETDGVLNAPTLEKLNADWSLLIKMIQYDLNYIRFLNALDFQQYVQVNIPSASIKLVENNRVTYAGNAVIGKSPTPTPSGMSKINQIVFFPHWYIPHNIATQEMLSSIQKDPLFLSNNGIQVLDNQLNVVDEFSIDWWRVTPQNFPYKLRQTAGSDNSLGMTKFDFENPFSIYIHDTNNKAAFNKSNRAMSHGCIRIENPLALAQRILPSMDVSNWVGIRQNKMDLKPNYTKVVPATPVLLTYLCSGIKNNQLVFFDDVYNKLKDFQLASN